MPKLEYLDIKNSRDDFLLKFPLTNLRKLKCILLYNTLDFNNFPAIEELYLELGISSRYPFFLNNFTNLSKLTINGLSVIKDRDDSPITLNKLTYLSTNLYFSDKGISNLTNLKYLKMRNGVLINDLCLQQLTQLKKLSIGSCINLTDESIKYLAGLTKLKILSNCVDGISLSINSLCMLTKLTKLEITGNKYELTVDVFRMLPRLFLYKSSGGDFFWRHHVND